MDTIPARDLNWLYAFGGSREDIRQICGGSAGMAVSHSPSLFFAFVCEWILYERGVRGRGKGRKYWEEVLFCGGEVAVRLAVGWSGQFDGREEPGEPAAGGHVRCYEVDEGLETLKLQGKGRYGIRKDSSGILHNPTTMPTTAPSPSVPSKTGKSPYISMSGHTGTVNTNPNPDRFDQLRLHLDMVESSDTDSGNTALANLSLTTPRDPDHTEEDEEKEEEIPDIDTVLARLRLDDAELAADGYQNIEYGDVPPAC